MFNQIFPMPARRFYIFIFFLLLISTPETHLFAQDKSMEVEARNLVFEAGKREFATGIEGLEIRMDLHFSQFIEDEFERNFTVFWRLENENGAVIFDAMEKDQYQVFVKARPMKVSAMVDEMEATGVKLFVPYRELGLETGEHALTLVLSGEFKKTTHKDFFRKNFPLDFRKRTLRSMEEQEIGVTEFSLLYDQTAPDEEKKGISMDFDLRLKYEINELQAGKYKVYFLINDEAGRLAYDSRNSKREFPVPVEIMSEGEGAMTLFVPYQEIDLSGPSEAKIEYYVEDQLGGTKLIHTYEGLLLMPERYAFMDQTFQTFNVEARADARHGVSGLYLGFTVEFGKSGPRSDPQRGPYKFRLNLNNGAGRAVLHTSDVQLFQSETTQMVREVLPDDPTRQRYEVSFFVPFRHIPLEKGEKMLRYVVNAGDESKAPLFRDIVVGEVIFQMPEVKAAEIELKTLDLKHWEGEVEKPDLDWQLRVGRDIDFRSDLAVDSYDAVPGVATVYFAPGDEIRFEAHNWDASQLMASYLLDLENLDMGVRVSKENDGRIRKLQLECREKAKVLSPFGR